MKTILYLCEKPSQARVLAKAVGAVKQEAGAFIGDGMVVTYGYGHMQNLAAPDDYIGNVEWRLEDLPILPGNWLWQVSESHREQFDNIGRWLVKVDSVVIATDPDDEGEVIGRQILKAHGYTGPVQRLWPSALNPESLHVALNNLLPLTATEPHYRAGMMRREMDWLLGMNLSRAFSIRFGRTAHIGRVKTRLLAELVKREREIEGYVPSHSGKACVNIGGHVFERFSTTWEVPSFSDHGIFVSSVEEMIEVVPPLPYSLSGLLIHASQSHGIGLARGYAAAQTLYEAGAISYPRTLSTSLPCNGATGFAAHHAIIATRDVCPSWAGDDAREIFRMVRLSEALQDLGCARISQRTTVFDFGGHPFTNITRWVTEDEAGWMLCVPDELDQLTNTNSKKGNYFVGQKVCVTPVVSKCESLIPKYYTEAMLLKMMVDNSIGTEATRVDAITSLVRDRVATFDSNQLRPTSAGRDLIERLPAGLIEELSRRTQEAIEQVKRDGGNRNTQLLGATKWLAKLIRGQAGVEFSQ